MWNTEVTFNFLVSAGEQLTDAHHQLIIFEADISDLDDILLTAHLMSHISCNNFPPLPSSPSSQWNLFSNDTCGGWAYGDESLWFCADCTLQKCLGICEPYPFAVYEVDERRCVCRTYCGHVFDGGEWVSYARVIEPPSPPPPSPPPMSPSPSHPPPSHTPPSHPEDPPPSHPPPPPYIVSSPSYPVASPPTSDTWNSRSIVIVTISVATLVTSFVTLMVILRFVPKKNVTSVPTQKEGK